MSKIKYYSTKDQFTHFSSMTTRWRDMDFRQHINHAAYLTYFETSRLEFAQNFFDENHTFIMASLTIDYHNQLTHPANLTIGQKVVEVGNKSFKMLGAIFKEEEINPKLMEQQDTEKQECKQKKRKTIRGDIGT